MVIDKGFRSHELDTSGQYDLNKGNQLASDQPDINHADIGGGGELLHDTEYQNTERERVISR